MGDPAAPSSPTPAPISPAESGGIFQNLVDLYFEPRKAFSRIVRSPGWVLPLLGAVVLASIFVGVWTTRWDPKEFMKTQMQESGQWEKLTAEQREQVMERQAPYMGTIVRVMGVVMTAVSILVVAAVLLFIFRFFYAGELGFKQALAITSWSMFAISLVTTPLILVVMALKGDWNLNPQDVLQANLGLLLDKAEVAKPLWALATSFDLFSLWLIFLLASGFAVASRKTTGSALWGVVIPWAIVVAFKVGWAALF